MANGELQACTICVPISGQKNHEIVTVPKHEPSAMIVSLTVVSPTWRGIVDARICMRCGQIYIPTT